MNTNKVGTNSILIKNVSLDADGLKVKGIPIVKFMADTGTPGITRGGLKVTKAEVQNFSKTRYSITMQCDSRGIDKRSVQADGTRTGKLKGDEFEVVGLWKDTFEKGDEVFVYQNCSHPGEKADRYFFHGLTIIKLPIGSKGVVVEENYGYSVDVRMEDGITRKFHVIELRHIAVQHPMAKVDSPSESIKVKVVHTKNTIHANRTAIIDESDNSNGLHVDGVPIMDFASANGIPLVTRGGQKVTDLTKDHHEYMFRDNDHILRKIKADGTRTRSRKGDRHEIVGFWSESYDEGEKVIIHRNIPDHTNKNRKDNFFFYIRTTDAIPLGTVGTVVHAGKFEVTVKLDSGINSKFHNIEIRRPTLAESAQFDPKQVEFVKGITDADAAFVPTELCAASNIQCDGIEVNGEGIVDFMKRTGFPGRTRGGRKVTHVSLYAGKKHNYKVHVEGNAHPKLSTSYGTRLGKSTKGDEFEVVDLWSESYKVGDRVEVFKPFQSPHRIRSDYFHGGKVTSVPIRAKGTVKRVSVGDYVSVKFDQGTLWAVHPVEIRRIPEESTLEFGGGGRIVTVKPDESKQFVHVRTDVGPFTWHADPSKSSKPVESAVPSSGTYINGVPIVQHMFDTGDYGISRYGVRITRVKKSHHNDKHPYMIKFDSAGSRWRYVRPDGTRGKLCGKDCARDEFEVVGLWTKTESKAEVKPEFKFPIAVQMMEESLIGVTRGGHEITDIKRCYCGQYTHEIRVEGQWRLIRPNGTRGWIGCADCSGDKFELVSLKPRPSHLTLEDKIREADKAAKAVKVTEKAVKATEKIKKIEKDVESVGGFRIGDEVKINVTSDHYKRGGTTKTVPNGTYGTVKRFVLSSSFAKKKDIQLELRRDAVVSSFLEYKWFVEPDEIIHATIPTTNQQQPKEATMSKSNSKFSPTQKANLKVLMTIPGMSLIRTSSDRRPIALIKNRYLKHLSHGEGLAIGGEGGSLVDKAAYYGPVALDTFNSCDALAILNNPKNVPTVIPTSKNKRLIKTKTRLAKKIQKRADKAKIAIPGEGDLASMLEIDNSSRLGGLVTLRNAAIAVGLGLGTWLNWGNIPESVKSMVPAIFTTVSAPVDADESVTKIQEARLLETIKLVREMNEH